MASNCPERRARAELDPPECCPWARGDASGGRIERQAHIAELAAGDDRQAIARSRTTREEQMLAADLRLAERRARSLECGLECLEDDIAAARALIKGRPE